mmetsp:Transcript_104716/g.191206  ORF Transcript_104716/g.191206 Transcript_104716/m.191206 type:complete len:602 (-) Transcript_104716:150-1955(-)
MNIEFVFIMHFTSMCRLVFVMRTIFYLFQHASSESSCTEGATVSYTCLPLGSPIPISAFASPRGSESVFIFAWAVFENVQTQANIVESSRAHIAKYTMFWSNCENIPQAVADISDPKNCTPHCAVEMFAPMGDQASMVAVQHVDKGWTFWNHFYVTIWCASANGLFDVSSFCNQNCVSYHPSRKNYFKHGLPKDVPHNASVVLIRGLSSISKDVFSTLNQHMASSDNMEVHVIQINSMDELGDGETADIIPDIIGELSLLDDVKSIYIAAATGQVEPLLISLTENSIRMENVLAMNTRIHAIFGIPENHVHAIFFASDDEKKKWQQCVIVPAYNSNLMDTNREWMWTISTSTRDALWSSSHPDLMDGFKRDVINHGLASISITLMDNNGRSMINYLEGFGLSEAEMIADERMDDSNNLFPFDPLSKAQGIFAWAIVPLWILVGSSSYLLHKWRMYETRAGCHETSLIGKLIGLPGQIHRVKKNPYALLSAALKLLGSSLPQPEYVAAHHCLSIIGVTQFNPATGESASGMWMQQGSNIVSPNWPFLFNAFPVSHMSQCGGLISTTALEQTTAPLSTSFGWRQKHIFMVLMAGALFDAHKFP